MKLSDGIDPPAERLDKDYIQQPGNSRKCIKCGIMHDTIVENMRTGERLEELKKCHDCIMSECTFRYDPNYNANDIFK